MKQAQENIAYMNMAGAALTCALLYLCKTQISLMNYKTSTNKTIKRHLQLTVSKD